MAERSTETAAAEVSIVAGTPEHLDGMAECHLMAFAGEFTSVVGRRFVRAGYAFYLSREGGITFVAVTSSNRVVGLVSGGAPELRRAFTLRRVPLYIPDVLLSGIKSGYARGRLMHHAVSMLKGIMAGIGLLSREKVAEPSPGAPGTWSSLLSICTDPDFRGRGIGKALMNAFEQESRSRGYTTMRLSVHNDNEEAIALYRNCGWEAILTIPGGAYFKKRLEPNKAVGQCEEKSTRNRVSQAR